MPLFLFIFIFYNIHTVQSSNHIHQYIRRGLSPSPHHLWLRGKDLPVVPSRESYSGLPSSKPTCYQLSHAAFLLCHLVVSLYASLLLVDFLQCYTKTNSRLMERFQDHRRLSICILRVQIAAVGSLKRYN